MFGPEVWTILFSTEQMIIPKSFFFFEKRLVVGTKEPETSRQSHFCTYLNMKSQEGINLTIQNKRKKGTLVLSYHMTKLYLFQSPIHLPAISHTVLKKIKIIYNKLLHINSKCRRISTKCLKLNGTIQ